MRKFIKSFVSEYKDFALGRGMDLAIGVIIGSAFRPVIDSLTNNLVSPISDLVNKYSNLYAPNAFIGRFIELLGAIIGFLITALVVFLMLKFVKSLKPFKRSKSEPLYVKCPYCFGDVSPKATRCPHCTSTLDLKIPEKE